MTGLTFVLTSAVLLAVAPLGTRAGAWSYVAGFALLAIGLLLALTGIVLSLISAYRTSHWGIPLAALAIGLVVLAIPLSFVFSARATPPIHDITTDTDDPPEFRAVLPLRHDARNPPEYGGAAVAERQRRAYPDIQTLALRLPASDAFVRALAAVRALGWDLVASDPEAGRIEAVDTTAWFGFKDDVVVRVREAADGARIDVRSKSRVGVGDAGANARRILAFLDALRREP